MLGIYTPRGNLPRAPARKGESCYLPVLVVVFFPFATFRHLPDNSVFDYNFQPRNTYLLVVSPTSAGGRRLLKMRRQAIADAQRTSAMVPTVNVVTNGAGRGGTRLVTTSATAGHHRGRSNENTH